MVVGGGVIGLSVAWEAASAGLSVSVVDPRPGRGATWAAAGMLAPVGEAHFGEEALTALNIAAARAWPGVRPGPRGGGRPLGRLRRADGTLLVAVDASDRAATDDLLGLPRPLGLDRRAAGVTGPAGHSSRCWPPGSGAGPTWPATTRWTTVGWSTPSSPPAGPVGSTSSTTRCPMIEVR